MHVVAACRVCVGVCFELDAHQDRRRGAGGGQHVCVPSVDTVADTNRYGTHGGNLVSLAADIVFLPPWHVTSSNNFKP